MNTFIRMLKDQSGASAAEYALILAIVGATIAVAAVLLGGSISNSMKRAGNCINAGSSATAGVCG
jgi:pilus assembly protein Flp/PilA